LLQEYFDFFDHRLPLTEKAVVEALQMRVQIEVVEPRTLPFTFKSKLPVHHGWCGCTAVPHFFMVSIWSSVFHCRSKAMALMKISPLHIDPIAW